MKTVPLLILFTLLSGCNYSLDKTPLLFKEGNAGLVQIPAGTVASYEVINLSIMQPKCIECHSAAAGDAGGVNLENFANVTANLDIIKSEVLADSMPKNRTKLTAREKELLIKWIDAGGPLNGVADTTPQTPAPTPTPQPAPDVQFISYEMVHVNVIQPRCLNCHSEAAGNRGDVNLETYENVAALSSVIEEEIKSGSMPRPKNKPLTPEQKDMILKWIANGSPKTN